MHRITRTLKHWKFGVRFYIFLAFVAVTLEVWWWVHANYSGSSLFATRLEEIFGWVSLGLLGLAVSIGPFFSVFPRVAGKKQWFEARRMIGVGAAWFALLHVFLAYKSLFNFINPLRLPAQYQQAFLFGAVALVVLLAMAGTSFDRAMKIMGPWWFRLHRLVYVAILALLMHVFIIGVHATRQQVLVCLAVVAFVVVGLHILQLRKKLTLFRFSGILLMITSLILVFNYAFTNQRNGSEIEGSSNAQAK